MKHFGRAALLLTLALCVPAFAAPEDQSSAMEMALDLAVARPIGIAVTTFGALAFVVSLPFSAAGGNIKQAANTLVVGPARETFVRCLGCKIAGRYQSPK